MRTLERGHGTGGVPSLYRRHRRVEPLDPLGLPVEIHLEDRPRRKHFDLVEHLVGSRQIAEADVGLCRLEEGLRVRRVELHPLLRGLERLVVGALREEERGGARMVVVPRDLALRKGQHPLGKVLVGYSLRRHGARGSPACAPSHEEGHCDSAKRSKTGIHPTPPDHLRFSVAGHDSGPGVG